MKNRGILIFGLIMLCALPVVGTLIDTDQNAQQKTDPAVQRVVELSLPVTDRTTQRN